MKILIIHYRYSISGGPERYLFNITKLLQEKGHEIIPFSINWNDNVDSKYSKYWPDLRGSDGEFHLNTIKKISFSDKLSILKNTIYNNVFTKRLKD